ncbi:deuterolysin metalloprotease family protein [Aspergillus campestris IBT 28561]|uniref:Neutral protease 2 n=1 Tax=Aspergillus campestris (strain IBT 28561) TaxID=1392248 RepID=A0A2I1DHQ1_ASPC2|nr:deuterolysin metalloprotease family protein [Aspergillus campestris IBT 28561]PKY09397.1 deuterolysin metalloprotease family protein [Aspergillus campestris IBT 28561]
MRTPSAAALLALLPSALAIPVSADSPSLDVTLTQVGNTRVKAVVKNVGSEDVTFVHLNFFKDSAPVKKVSLFRESSEVAFEGVKKRFRSKGLTKDALTSLAPGAVIEDEFDIASTSDLTKGGSITVRTSGRVPTAKNSAIVGSIPYSSNELTITVDGAEAAKVAHATKDIVKRTEMTECSGEKQSALETALKNSVSLATKAAAAAESGDDARFEEYFSTTDAETRSTVAERLQAVAKESGSTTSGNTQYYCEDTLGYCEPNVLAWTLPAQNIIANCDIYYSELPALASGCHDQDQATTSLHEFTHAPGTFSPGTDDLGYGYDAATALSTEDALNNADSYALFANAVYLDC